MTVIQYNGPSSSRIVTAEQFAEAGLSGVPTIVWNKANNYEVDVDDLTAAFLIVKDSHFVPEDVNVNYGTLVSGSGRIIGHAKNTAGGVIGAVTTPTSLAGGGLIKTVTVGLKPISVEWGGLIYHTQANQTPRLHLFEDGVAIDMVAETSEVASAINTVWKKRVLTPSAGEHTYEVKLGQTNAVASASALGTTATPVMLVITEG